ncbi:MFS transporter [Labrys monachus]|uniref:MFS family permease n=1 Tax=Labrys monachus TaxID=217067 RepID=A0ABU0FB59_9HYPH|nr:MFS transporter [Labrys monachus]MDQ0391854.1 MFS family permease [Labrys monachus]
MSIAQGTARHRVPASPSEASPDPRRWAALLVLLAGTLLSPLDFFIVNVALPSIRDDLGASSSSIQMVVSAYSAAYAVLLITGGRLGDIYGRRLAFVVGLVGFGVASALCGLAWSPAMLVASRVLQGVFAALLMPQSLASIRTLFPERERPRAMGFYAMTFGIGSIAGQLLGGLLIAANPFGLGWRSVFLVNLPIVMVVAPLAHMLLKESREGEAPRLDTGGVLLLGAALTALIVPLIEGREQGWPLWSLVSLAACVPLFLLFWRHEHRVVARGGAPLVVPSLLDDRGLRRGLAAALFFNTLSAFFLAFAIYEQSGNHLSPLAAGIAILPLAIGFVISPTALPWLLVRLGHRTPTLAAILLALGAFGTSAAALSGQGWAMPPALFVVGFAQGLALPTMIRTVLERVDRRWAGLSAGLVNTMMQISGSLSVALAGGLFYTVLGTSTASSAITLAFASASGAVGVSVLVSAWLIDGVRPAAGKASAVPGDGACETARAPAIDFVAGH